MAPSSGRPRPASSAVRPFNLHALELLVAVEETGSISQAAAELSISQPTASARMTTLERRLGIRLLERSTSGSRLTPAGLLFTAWARDVLSQAQTLADSLATLQVKQGNLRVAASLTLAEYLLPRWLIALRQLHPTTHVELKVANSHQVIEALLHAEADIGFTESPFVPRDFRSALVGRDRLVVVTAPDHPWTRRSTPLTGAELAETPLLLRESGSGTRETLERALRPWHGPSVPLLELGSTGPLRSAATQGAAPAVLSELAVVDDLAAGRLVEIPVTDDLPLARQLRAIWPSRLDLCESARHLLEVARRSSRGA